jgi:hypothetical protein
MHLIHTQTLNPLLPHNHSKEVLKHFIVKSWLEHLNPKSFTIILTFKSHSFSLLLSLKRIKYLVKHHFCGALKIR